MLRNPCSCVLWGLTYVQYATAPYALLQGFLLLGLRRRCSTAPPAFMYSSYCDAFYGASRAVRTFGVVQYATAPYALLRGFLLFVRVAEVLRRPLVLLVQRP